MKHWHADGNLLERYEVEDGVRLGIANEFGDITAYVYRPDGSRGHAYGGPVYDPPEFTNVCARVEDDIADGIAWRSEWVCTHDTDLTPAELATADAFARKVGWMS